MIQPFDTINFGHAPDKALNSFRVIIPAEQLAQSMDFTALRCGSGVAAFVSALGPLLSAGAVLHLLEYAGDLIQLIWG